MKSIIIMPKNEMLKKHIQYFLFFKKDDNQILNYTTFPNNNLCLSIYKENNINYNKNDDINHCIINKGNNGFVSRLYGFHKIPFQVDIHSSLDQVCILFYPSSLRAFTADSYHSLLLSESVFEEIFSNESYFVLERIFASSDFTFRAELLEYILLKKLKNEISPKLQEAICVISNSNVKIMSIEALKIKLGISEATLFRLFTNHLGQSPKSYIKTIRFRNTLNDIVNSKMSLTHIAYSHQFYDQAHFIKDMKTFSGNTPKQLINKLSIHQNNLVWIYNEKICE